MIIYPAIDLLEGRAVRLTQGRREEATDYGDPVETARRWRRAGAKWLHLVDLTGAFDGKSRHAAVIHQVIEAFQGPVELGGGIRTMADIEIRLEALGVTRCILGTAAVEDPDLVKEACRRYPGRIACGIDAKNGMAMLRGWVQQTPFTASELALSMKSAGVRTIIYTDVARDGMMQGPNSSAAAQLVKETGMDVIGSGGVNSIESLIKLKSAGCAGAITGKALYENAFSLEDAIAATGEESK